MDGLGTPRLHSGALARIAEAFTARAQVPAECQVRSTEIRVRSTESREYGVRSVKVVAAALRVERGGARHTTRAKSPPRAPFLLPCFCACPCPIRTCLMIVIAIYAAALTGRSVIWTEAYPHQSNKNNKSNERNTRIRAHIHARKAAYATKCNTCKPRQKHAKGAPPPGGEGARVGIPFEGAGFESTTRRPPNRPPLNPRHRPRTRGLALTDGQSQRVGVGPGSRAPRKSVVARGAGVRGASDAKGKCSPPMLYTITPARRPITPRPKGGV